MTNHRENLLYKKVADLTPMSDGSFEKLFTAAIQKHVLKGANILREGQLCNAVFFVEQGYLRTFILKDDIEINTDFVFENNFTTNLKSLRLTIPSETYIQAGENSTIYEFPKTRLLELYKESPEIESFGRRLLEELLMAQEEHTNLFKIFSPAERYQ